MSTVHHSAIVVTDVEASLRFWRDGLGFEVVMDQRFDGDWPTLFHAPSTSLRAIFLGDPRHPRSGIVELVDLGLGGPPRRIDVSGVAMAVVTDPDGVLVELVDSGATANLDRLTEPEVA